MMQKPSTVKTITIAACAVMLLCALLLPLVSVMSYHWGIGELPHKLSRLVSSGLARGVGYALLALLLLSPVAQVLFTLLKGRAPKAVALLPVVAAVLFTVVLFVATPPSPAIGLWIYLAAAVCAAVAAFMKEKTNTL